MTDLLARLKFGSQQELNVVSVGGSLLPAPAGDGAAVFRHPPLRAFPSRNALPKSIHALRAKPRKTGLLRGSAPIARHKGIPNLPLCACADLRFASPFPLRLRLLSKGGETPPLAPCYPRLRQEAFGM